VPATVRAPVTVDAPRGYGYWFADRQSWSVLGRGPTRADGLPFNTSMGALVIFVALPSTSSVPSTTRVSYCVSCLPPLSAFARQQLPGRMRLRKGLQPIFQSLARQRVSNCSRGRFLLALGGQSRLQKTAAESNW